MIQAVVLACKMPFFASAVLPISISTVTNNLSTESRIGAVTELIGPILSLDLGAKRVGLAVSDPTLVALTRLGHVRRTNWKQLLRDVRDLIRRFDAKTLVIGFPLSLDGSEGSAALAARDAARKFALSLSIPVYLQDERLSSAEAEAHLHAEGVRGEAMTGQVDSESAVIILRDFLEAGQHRILVERP
jgi:putative holliday junction resolvase